MEQADTERHVGCRRHGREHPEAGFAPLWSLAAPSPGPTEPQEWFPPSNTPQCSCVFLQVCLQHMTGSPYSPRLCERAPPRPSEAPLRCLQHTGSHPRSQLLLIRNPPYGQTNHHSCFPSSSSLPIKKASFKYI